MKKLTTSLISQPTEEEKHEELIDREIVNMQREKAIERLISEGKLPFDYRSQHARMERDRF